MIPNKALSQVIVDRKAGKKPPKKKQTIEDFIEEGGEIKVFNKKGKLISKVKK